MKDFFKDIQGFEYEKTDLGYNVYRKKDRELVIKAIVSTDPNGPNHYYPETTPAQLEKVVKSIGFDGDLEKHVIDYAHWLGKPPSGEEATWCCVACHRRPDGHFKMEWVSQGFQLTVNVYRNH